MTNRCPKCGAEWPQALRRPPFPAIACSVCEHEREKRERQEAAHQRRTEELKRDTDATVAKFQAMTPEERAELDAKLDAIWG